ncbi:MAG: DUF3800 domain-containing protein [Candidatus Woesearchaeota archaeon]
MVYIYLDESGDLGFSERGSKYFILTCVKIDDEKTNILFKRIPKEIRERALKKRILKQSELKFSNSTVLIRKRFLTRAAMLNISVYSLIIDKKFTQEKLKENLPILYNYLIKILLENVITPKNKIEICLDKCMSTNQRNNFENYVKTEFFSKFKLFPDLKITHEDSKCNPALQVIDFICGAFGYKYNTAKLMGNCEYYTDIIKNKIIIERNNFFKQK